MSNPKNAINQIKNLMKQYGFLNDEPTLQSFKLEDNTIVETLKLKAGEKITKLSDEFNRVALESGSYRLVENFEIEVKEGEIVSVKEILLGINSLLNKVFKLDFWLCGHNIKNFDIPVLNKRMVINGIKPSPLLPSFDTKPWEIKAIDTRDVWQYGQYASISTLDLMCGVMGVESSKSDEMDGSRVHEVFYKEKNIDKINTYCEKDVKVLYEVVKKLQNLL